MFAPSPDQSRPKRRSQSPALRTTNRSPYAAPTEALPNQLNHPTLLIMPLLIMLNHQSAGVTLRSPPHP
jgi:hypothetical protein